nr:MAG TPA: hypothetical protein [Caudoviricetes sp.]
MRSAQLFPIFLLKKSGKVRKRGASFQAKRLKRSNFNEYREQIPKQNK